MSSFRTRVRKLAALTGCRPSAARREILGRGRLIGALKRLTGMTNVECDAAVCFEDDFVLRSRYGQELFDQAAEEEVDECPRPTPPTPGRTPGQPPLPVYPW